MGLPALVFALVEIAAVAQAAPLETSWEAEYKTLCTYDTLCTSVKGADEKFKSVSPHVLAAIKELKTEFIDAGKLYAVDPRAIAGAIAAENSLNVAIDDDIQDLLVKLKIAKNGSILGKKFTFGWGQLYMEAAWEAEELAAQVEGRKKRTQDELAQDLLVPKKAVLHVAAVLKFIQNNYKTQGFDIANDPAILSTVYNLGKSKARAVESRAAGRKPRVNYFGFFVKYNLAALEKALGIAAKTPDSATTQLTPGTTVEETATSQNAEKLDTPMAAVRASGPIHQNLEAKTDPSIPKAKGSPETEKNGAPTSNELNKAFAKATKPLNTYKAWTAIKDFRLLDSHESCGYGGYGVMGAGGAAALNRTTGSSKDYLRIMMSVEGSDSGVLRKGETFEKVSPGIGCDLEEWSLVRGESGSTGWIKDSDLESGAEERFGIQAQCDDALIEACAERLPYSFGILGAQAIEKDSAGVTLRLSGSGNKRSYKYPDVGCSADLYPGLGLPSPTPSGPEAQAPFSYRAVEKLQLDDLEGKFKSWRNLVAEKLKLKQNPACNYYQSDPFACSANPYNFVKGPDFHNCRQQVNRPFVNGYRTACFVDIASFETALQTQIVPRPGLSLIRQLNFNFQKSAVTTSQHQGRSPTPSPTVDEKQKKLIDERLGTEHRKVKDACGFASADQLPEVHKYLGEIETTISNFNYLDADWETVLPVFARIEAVCAAYSELMTRPKPKPGTESSDIYWSTQCDVQTTDEYTVVTSPMSGSMTTSARTVGYPTRLQLIQMLLSDLDKDAYLVGTLKKTYNSWATHRSVSSGQGSTGGQFQSPNPWDPDSEHCKYSPIKTAEVIDKLMENPCVEAAHVPDPYLVRKLRSKYPGRIVYRPFIEDDRYRIEYRRSCKKVNP